MSNLPDDAPHLLVVDDDERIRNLIARYLGDQGFRVTRAGNPAQARAAMEGIAFDLIILDIMMPGESGIEFAGTVRQRSNIPIIMLTALAEPDNRIAGLETGVDDYLTKPFEPRELLLRIKSILRRIAEEPAQQSEVHSGEFVFHIARGELQKGGESIKLTERERELLRLFATQAGQPISRQELAASGNNGSDRAVDVQINRLRRKIEVDPTNPVFLQTVRGQGYILYAS